MLHGLAIRQLLERIENNEIDILIGTQMVSKGYHFPNLTLVGVIDSDLGMFGGDLRASERTYQLLHQVGGRAGREVKKGMILLQSYYPNNIVLDMLKNNMNDQFIEYELANRFSGDMPPFTKMAAMILTDKNEAKLIIFAKSIVQCAPISSAKIFGPARAMMAKLAGKYRYRILIVADRKFNLQQYLRLWLSLFKTPASCHIKIDIDPQNFV
jgi:primosomal protein N' (replication factor Y)